MQQARGKHKARRRDDKKLCINAKNPLKILEGAGKIPSWLTAPVWNPNKRGRFRQRRIRLGRKRVIWTTLGHQIEAP